MLDYDGDAMSESTSGSRESTSDTPRSNGSGEGGGARSSGEGAESSASRFGEIFFAVQKCVIGRAWSLLLVTLAGEIGGYVIHKSWDGVSQASGRTMVQVLLLVLGLIAFWISPGRAGFMRRLCFLLVFVGGVLVSLAWGFEVLGGRAVEPNQLKAVQDTWIGELGLMWLMFGVFLGVLMWGGRFVFSKWRETPDAAARRAGTRARADDSPRGS